MSTLKPFFLKLGEEATIPQPTDSKSVATASCAIPECLLLEDDGLFESHPLRSTILSRDVHQP